MINYIVYCKKKKIYIIMLFKFGVILVNKFMDFFCEWELGR